jgi:hypothetical protein
VEVKEEAVMTFEGPASRSRALRLLSSAGALLLWLFLPPQAAAAQPTGVGVTGIAYHGDGCPSGAARHTVSPDGRSFTVLFDSFLAEVGPEGGRVARRTCVLDVSVDVPKGRSYALTADYRGLANLEAGMKAVKRSFYEDVGRCDEDGARGVLRGVFVEDYVFRDAVFDPPDGGRAAARAPR